jgi:hypothetical protein
MGYNTVPRPASLRTRVLLQIMQFAGCGNRSSGGQFPITAYFYKNVRENNLHEAYLTEFVPPEGGCPSQTQPARQQDSNASSLVRQDLSSDDCDINIRTVCFKKTYKNAASPEMREGCLATMPTIKHVTLTVKDCKIRPITAGLQGLDVLHLCKPNAWEELSAAISTATVVEAGLTCAIFASFHAGGLALFDSLGYLGHCVAFL